MKYIIIVVIIIIIKMLFLFIYFYFEQYLFGGAQFSWIEWGPDEKKKTTQKTITDKKNWNN